MNAIRGITTEALPMLRTYFIYSFLQSLILVCCLTSLSVAHANEDSSELNALQQKVKQLEQQLQAARDALSNAEQQRDTALKQVDQTQDKLAEVNAKDEGIRFGPLKIGGAMRANYVVGDYPESDTGAASRAVEDGGDFALDTFRVNLDYQKDKWLGKVEYRWYSSYNFLHTGWVGYQFDENRQLQVGVNRVPFGPGPYGVSQSWLFDQHYYLGLSDDMDLGVKLTQQLGRLKLDTAYYISDEGSYKGASSDSARYSYDVVNESGQGYEEKNQFNIRAIYNLPGETLNTDFGVSLQYSELSSKGVQSDGDHYAASMHMVNKWNNFTLASQITYYDYDVSALQPLGTDKLVQMGAYDFPSTAAAEAWIPAISLSYYQATNNIAWLDYVIPYIEYSSVVKAESEFNDSRLATLGAAFGYGGWYIYTDWAYSTGNEFVGGDTTFGDRLGANAEDEWESRFNINFGYYF
ncbi:MAG: hypothetical protein RQ732_08835 [Methylophaga sp.]|nr:hypothetical protein [Methylophaga sp.]